MVVKEEVFKTDDGKVEFVAKQLSFASQMRLQKLKEKSILDIYKECIDKPELLEKLDLNDGIKLAKLIDELNGWNKKSDEQDFQKTA